MRTLRPAVAGYRYSPSPRYGGSMKSHRLGKGSQGHLGICLKVRFQSQVTHSRATLGIAKHMEPA